MNKNRDEVEKITGELVSFYANSNFRKNINRIRYEDLDEIIELTRTKYTVTRFDLKKIEPDEFSKEQLVK